MLYYCIQTPNIHTKKSGQIVHLNVFVELLQQRRFVEFRRTKTAAVIVVYATYILPNILWLWRFRFFLLLLVNPIPYHVHAQRLKSLRRRRCAASSFCSFFNWILKTNNFHCFFLMKKKFTRENFPTENLPNGRSITASGWRSLKIDFRRVLSKFVFSSFSLINASLLEIFSSAASSVSPPKNF